jgi:hypothetical protein
MKVTDTLELSTTIRDGNCAHLPVNPWPVDKNPIKIGYVLHFIPIPMGFLLGQKLCLMGKWAWVITTHARFARLPAKSNLHVG